MMAAQPRHPFCRRPWWQAVSMAKFVYIDETGSTGRNLQKHPFLTLVAVIVREDQVQPLSNSLRQVVMEHLGWLPAGFEFHGHELWNGTNDWEGRTPEELLAAYAAALELLESHDVDVAHSTINRVLLHDRYKGAWDDNAYLLALQFLLERVDANLGADNKVLIADEAKEQQVRAIQMVADLQTWSVGEVPGQQLHTIIDSLHFVSSHASFGVQMADLVAFILGHRRRRPTEGHPTAETMIRHFMELIQSQTRTYRMPWPS